MPHGSRDNVMIPDSVKITFNLGIESTDKTRSIVNKIGRALVKKKALMLGSNLATQVFTTLTRIFT